MSNERLQILKEVASQAQSLLELREDAARQRETLENSLSEYIRHAWHVVEPETVFLPNWHIDAVAEHLEAVADGEVLRLILNFPPGCMKSLVTSVFFHGWMWTKKPSKRFMYASYSHKLAERDSVKSRRVIQSPWYQDIWADVYQLLADQNTKGRYENTATGYRVITSPDGSGIGERGDIVIVDDPHNTKEVMSDAMRINTLRWWDETMGTRLNNPKNGAKIIVMQRLHERDLTGHILAREHGYVVLKLPMEYEPRTKCFTKIGFEDPRSYEGELLCPMLHNHDTLKELKAQLGSFGSAAQLQQNPKARGSGMFDREWFEIVKASPADAKRIRYWDMAATEKTVKAHDPDYTAGCRMSEKDGIYYIEKVRRKRARPLAIEKLIKQEADLDSVSVHIWMEQEPGASGVSTVDHYARRVLKGFTFKGDSVRISKESRADPMSSAAEAGNVKLIQGDWNEDFLDEIEGFPASAHNDQVDAASGAFNKLQKGAPIDVW